MPVHANSSCVQDMERAGSYVATVSMQTTIIGAVSFLILTVLLGNALVIASILKFKRMRNVQNILLFSLSTSDMLLGVMIVPLTLAYELLGYWPLGQIACKAYLLLDIALCTSSIWTLCMISINRFLAIKLGPYYKMQNTVKNGVGMVVTIWIFSILVCMPAFSIAHTSSDRATVCSHSEELWFIMYSVSFSFYIPLVIMCVMYATVIWQFKQKTKKTKVQSSLLRKEKKMYLLVGITMAAFIVCWLPFFVMYSIQAACVTCCVPPLLMKFAEWLGYVNSAINPIIYSITKEEFRDAFKALLMMKDSRANRSLNNSSTLDHPRNKPETLSLENLQGKT